MHLLKRLSKLITISAIISVFCTVSFVEIRELFIARMAHKALPLKVGDQIFCSSSQVDYKGARFTLTNRHCCEVAQRVYGLAPNDILEGHILTVGDSPKEILALDNKHDLCILEPELDRPSLSLANSYQIGEPVFMIGHPRGLNQTIREGRIIQEGSLAFMWMPLAGSVKFFLFSSLGYPGNSGSPVIDRFGRLVGVAFAGDRRYHTELFAVPVEAVKEFLDEYIGEDE